MRAKPKNTNFNPLIGVLAKQVRRLIVDYSLYVCDSQNHRMVGVGRDL